MLFSLKIQRAKRSLHSVALDVLSAFPPTLPKVFIPAVLVLGISSSAVAADLLNINSADATAIADALSGIGPAKAQAIVEYRQLNGTFMQLEELTNVPGIGDSTLEQIRALVTVGDPPAE